MTRAAYENFFLVICGPTGSGKTDLSYALARRFPVEIINCDVGQFYVPLSIGTAKPPWRESAIPHHLFDCIEAPQDFTVIKYRQMVQEKMVEIWSRNAIPVVVGGSLFYLRALFFPPEEKQACTAMAARSAPATSPKQTEELWSELFAIDPTRAAMLGKNDRYRIQRALDIWRSTGELPSEKRPVFAPFAQFHVTCVVRDRAELYHRIDERVLTMLKEGWVEEVNQLSEEWKSYLMHKKILGYPEIMMRLDDDSLHVCASDRELIAVLQQKTRNYAKRQMTFWRALKRDLEREAGATAVGEIDLTLSSVDLYLEHTQRIVDMRTKECHE